MDDKQSSDTESEFEKHWLKTEASDESVYQDIRQIRDYARLAFDKLDLDSNGFIERQELFTFLSSDKVSNREKSFITFLLNNQQAIADMTAEASPGPRSQKRSGELFRLDY